jgi:uncharacterized protein involved in type VI secretion and phage assembly
VTRAADGEARRYFGVYPAIVTNIVDDKHLGRIQVKFPWLGRNGSDKVRAWATLLSPYADKDQGLEILPSVDSQVVCAFEAGDLRRPYIVGAGWNGQEALPQTPEAANNKRLWKTRSGSVLEFDDTDSALKITLSLKDSHKLVLDDSGDVTLKHKNGCVLTLEQSGKVTITANSTVDVTASTLNVHAATANFDGTVNCTTLNASTSVVSPSYTTGAGNVW